MNCFPLQKERITPNVLLGSQVDTEEEDEEENEENKQKELRQETFKMFCDKKNTGLGDRELSTLTDRPITTAPQVKLAHSKLA